MNQLAKGVEAMAHSVTLSAAKNEKFRIANKALSKRRRAKKTRLRQGGLLTTQGAQEIFDQEDMDVQLKRNMHENLKRGKERTAALRRCGNCGKPSHNTRTCQVQVEAFNVYISQ